jgi:hypothetical protein
VDRLVEKVFPIGLASPKYLRAMLRDSTTDSGCARALAGSPAAIGRRISFRKLASTTATRSLNLRSPAIMVIHSSLSRVKARTSGIWSRITGGIGIGAWSVTISPPPGTWKVTSRR